MGSVFPWVLEKNLGAVETIPHISVPDGYMTRAVNVRLSEHHVLAPRRGVSFVSTSGGATVTIIYVFVERGGGTETIWTVVVSGAGLAAYRSNVAVALSDTTANDVPQLCAYNGKVFLAYNSDVNRLHVYSEGVIRRVGIGIVAAATVANFGTPGVVYPATLRYYKVQMRLHKNADASQQRIASSELSAVVSFTPSGAGTAARVTKPATIDSATHWAVYGSADGITYYDISGSLAVSATTYDDIYLTNNYWATGPVSPEAGLFVPPPSCKFLATNGERLFMAGAWETTASAGQTTPTPRRVWFTRPSGATDQGDDEAITQTSDLRYYLDLDNSDGSEITGLASTIDGGVYAFTRTSVWRLNNTGNSDTPLIPQRVASGVGVVNHQSIVTVDSLPVSSGVYFMSESGPYRYTPSRGLEFIGEDWVVPVETFGSGTPALTYIAGYDPAHRELYFSSPTAGIVRVLRLDYLQQIQNSLRGGWSRNEYAMSHASASAFRINSCDVFSGKLLIAGTSVDGGDLLATPSSANDDIGSTFTSTIVTPTRTFGPVVNRAHLTQPYVWKKKATAVVVTANRDFGGTDGGFVSATSGLVGVISGEADDHVVKMESLEYADMAALSLKVEILAGNVERPVYRIVVPLVTHEQL